MKASRELIGASLLAAAGSLPLHVMPLLVESVVGTGELAKASGGSVGTAALVGQLLAVTLLPLSGWRVLDRRHTMGALALLVICLLFNLSIDGWMLLATWFGVGVASGTLTFVGIAAAARQCDKGTAFAVRLTVSLAAAGLVAMGAAALHATHAHRELSMVLIAAFIALATLGTLLYQPADAGETAAPSHCAPAAIRPGLLVMFAFFAGQIGHWSYTLVLARERGLGVESTMLAIGACKLMAAVVVASQAGAWLRQDSRSRALMPSLLCLAIVAMQFSASIASFVAALLLWELALNTLSVRLQTALAGVDARSAGQWMGAAALLGSACGPLLYGSVVGSHGGLVAMAGCVVSTAIAWVWLRSRQA